MIKENNNQVSVDRLIKALAEIMSTDDLKVKIKVIKKESPDSLAASGIQDDSIAIGSSLFYHKQSSL